MLVSSDSAGGPAKKKSVFPSIASDGSAIVFVSHADNLLSGDKTRGVQTYRCDLATKQISVVTVNGEGKRPLSAQTVH
jgi:hypothetical protein